MNKLIIFVTVCLIGCAPSSVTEHKVVKVYNCVPGYDGGLFSFPEPTFIEVKTNDNKILKIHDTCAVGVGDTILCFNGGYCRVKK